MDPDQTAPFRSSPIRVHTVCWYAKIGLKSLQEFSADDINRRHFSDADFLGVLKVKYWACWVKFSEDNLLKYFSYFSQKTGFDILCRLSPLKTICMKCRILFFLGKIKKDISLSSNKISPWYDDSFFMICLSMALKCCGIVGICKSVKSVGLLVWSVNNGGMLWELAFFYSCRQAWVSVHYRIFTVYELHC